MQKSKVYDNLKSKMNMKSTTKTILKYKYN